MYLLNKYTRCYYNIIERAKSRDLPKEIYTENHHIIPKSLGGDNTKNNLVTLTAKEHRLVHILLPKMTIDPVNTQKMWYALWMILRTNNLHQKRKISKGRAFEVAKNKVAENSSKLHKGKTVSKESREKLSKSCLGRPSAFKEKKHSEESKKILSNKAKNYPQLETLKEFSKNKRKPCVSPIGESFPSTTDAGIAYGVSGQAIGGLIKRGKSGWKYERGEDQKIIDDALKEKKKKIHTTHSEDHVRKRVESRKKNGHYKNREESIKRMSEAAKIKHSKNKD